MILLHPHKGGIWISFIKAVTNIKSFLFDGEDEVVLGGKKQASYSGKVV